MALLPPAILAFSLDDNGGQADTLVSPYSSPVPVALYPTLAALLIFSGLGSTAVFFVQQATRAGRSPSIWQDLLIGGVSSLLLGWGFLFLLLSTGVYV